MSKKQIGVGDIVSHAGNAKLCFVVIEAKEQRRILFVRVNVGKGWPMAPYKSVYRAKASELSVLAHEKSHEGMSLEKFQAGLMQEAPPPSGVDSLKVGDIVKHRARVRNQYTVVEVNEAKKTVVIEKDGKKYLADFADLSLVLSSPFVPVLATGTPMQYDDLAPSLHEKFETLVCKLEPEALTCDGECSRVEISRKLAQIRYEWAQLERQIGFRVTESMVWDRVFDSRKESNRQ